MQIDYLDHLPDEFISSAVRLFLNALKDKMVPIFGNDGRTQDYFEDNLDTKQCLAAICDQKLVGILGLQTDSGGFLNPTLKTLVKTYGILDGTFKMGGVIVLHHPTGPDELYVDGVCVVDDMRSLGIGSRLFDLLEKIALKKGIRLISLDVIETNHRAKTLYDQLGFVETKRQSIWPFNFIYKFPFKASTEMVKMLG